jgi:hypothetical protein
MLERPRPRFVEVRRLADGLVAFYFCIPKYYRKLGCEIANEPLGTSYEAACGEDGKGGRAAAAKCRNRRRGIFIACPLATPKHHSGHSRRSGKARNCPDRFGHARLRDHPETFWIYGVS